MSNTRPSLDDGEVRLSPRGARRRQAIGTILATAARNRRRGRVALATGTGVAALVAVLAGVYALVPRPQAGELATEGPAHVPIVMPADAAPSPTVVRVAIVTNEPLPDRPCPETGGSGSAGVSVCIIDDDRLLRELGRTGESFGLVRIGGRTEVVRNSR